MRFGTFRINTDFLKNQLQKYFYTKHLRLLLHFNKKFLLSFDQSFRNILFLPLANQLSQRMSCAIFQTNAGLRIIYQNINNFLHKRLYIPPLFRKKWRSLSQAFLGTFTFCYIFTFFKSE